MVVVVVVVVIVVVVVVAVVVIVVVSDSYNVFVLAVDKQNLPCLPQGSKQLILLLPLDGNLGLTNPKAAATAGAKRNSCPKAEQQS